MTLAGASWGPAWPQHNPNIVTLVRKDGLRIPIHKELAPLAALCMDLTEAMGYDIKPGQTWGFAYRPISGTKVPSNHSKGTAIDINAPANPYASAAWHERNGNVVIHGHRRKTDIPVKVFDFWKSQGFTLGVDYTTKPDPMHFEFLGTVAEARKKYADLKAFLASAGGKTPAPKPAPAVSSKVDRIKKLQRLVGVKDDGIWGPDTEGGINRNLIAWSGGPAHKSFAGNKNGNLVKFLREQGNRKFNDRMAVTSTVDAAVNHLIVVQLGQRDGIAGPNAWKKAVS